MSTRRSRLLPAMGALSALLLMGTQPALAYNVTVTIPTITITIPDSTTSSTATTTTPSTTTTTTTPTTTTGTTAATGTTTGTTTATTGTAAATTTTAAASLGTINTATKTITLNSGVEIADALVAPVTSNWTIIAAAGTYKKTFSTGGTFDNLTIKCATLGACTMDGQGGYGGGHRLAWGKACIHSYNNTITVVGFKLINCGEPQSGSSYSNEAGIYLDIDDGNNAHTLNVVNDVFDNNANALFSAGGAGAVLVDTSVFGYKQPNGMNGYVNGTASGPAHDMYLQVGQNGTVEVKGSYFYGSAGHNVKVRGGSTNIHDNPVMTYDGGRVADLADGGKLLFTNNSVWARDDSIFPARTIQSGVKAGTFGNGNMLAVGDESTTYGVPSGAFSGNTFYIGRTGTVLWLNGGSMTAANDKISYYGTGVLTVQGTVTGDISGGSATATAAAHAPAPPAPPAWAK